MLKQTKKYYFSLEGETEKWYLNWLKKTINEQKESKYQVKFDSKVEKDPCSRVKKLSSISGIKILHIIDMESNSNEHQKNFHHTLDRMSKAEKMGKTVSYSLGYSNYTFELWLILHKMNCNSPLTDRKQYLAWMNKAYGKNFQSLNEYKKERNFQLCILEQLTIENVKQAIYRAKKIMENNKLSCQQIKYGKYSYYKENPSLSLGQEIENIVKDCQLIT